jgi:hypothetical protein
VNREGLFRLLEPISDHFAITKDEITSVHIAPDHVSVVTRYGDQKVTYNEDVK